MTEDIVEHTLLNVSTQENDIGGPDDIVLKPINMDDIFHELYSSKEENLSSSQQIKTYPKTTPLKSLQEGLVKSNDESEYSFELRKSFSDKLAKKTGSTDYNLLILLGRLVSKKIQFGVTYSPNVEQWVVENMKLLL
ncbi:unnamed protein product [marine sediment metagenome]|uniref:Uncharacterized protein n=1 Tax=marine sediment metagenome TaxID=412755 RepID=X1D829_9ZZZZ